MNDLRAFKDGYFWHMTGETSPPSWCFCPEFVLGFAAANGDLLRGQYDPRSAFAQAAERLGV